MSTNLLTNVSVSQVLAAPVYMPWFSSPKHKTQLVSPIRFKCHEEFLISTTDDNTSTIYWCLIEADLFIVVACMPSIHAVFHRMWSRTPTNTSAGYVGSDKNSYFNRKKSGSAHPSSGISKSTEVSVYTTKRSEASDVELVTVVT
jgi:hypothetical protein